MSNREGSGLQNWLTARTAIWRRLSSELEIFERKRTHTAAEALQAVETYRSLGRDLSIARRVLPASRMTRALEERYLRLHAIIHRKPHDWRARLRTLLNEAATRQIEESGTGTPNNFAARSSQSVVTGGILDEQVTAT